MRGDVVDRVVIDDERKVLKKVKEDGYDVRVYIVSSSVFFYTHLSTNG